MGCEWRGPRRGGGAIASLVSGASQVLALSLGNLRLGASLRELRAELFDAGLEGGAMRLVAASIRFILRF